MALLSGTAAGRGGDKTTRRRTRLSDRVVLDLSPATRYAVAIAAALGAIALRLALDPIWGVRLPFITLFPAIMLSAWLGGIGPGIVATLVCGAAATYFWIEPARSWVVAEWSEALGPAVFVGVGCVISALNEAWRRGAAAVAESEERLRVTLTSIGDAVVTTDDEGRVTHLNAIAERLTGWSAADAVGRPLREVLVLINEQSRQPAPNPVDRVLRDGVIAGLANHTLLVSRDGREIQIDDSAAPIWTADDRMAGVVMVFRDIGERRRAERERTARLEEERSARRELEAMARQLESALEAGRMGTWQYTMATGEVKWSPGLEAIHGYGPGAFAGTFEAFRDEIHDGDRERVLAAIAEAAEQRRPHQVEYRIVRLDGAVRWVQGIGQVLYDEQGRPERMMGVCADITDRRQAEDERAALLVREQAARAEIEHASRLKDEFLAVLSHELRTPLNAVLGYAHLLSSGALTPERAGHALEAIRRNAQAQARLVDSLLDMSRILAGKLDLKLEPVELSKIVNDAVDVIRPQAEEKGVTLDVVMPPSGLILDADSGRLQQVLWNLASNAVKFTSSGGRIEVRVSEESGRARIQVSDNGQGISADFLPHVFDRFAQGASGRQRSAGLGLGLALVREMVHAHGGTVVAESPGDNRGSTFAVTLPLSRAADVRPAAKPLEPLDA